MPHAQLLSPSPLRSCSHLPVQARELGAAFARAKELPAEMPLEIVLSGNEPGLFWSYFVNGWCAGAASRTARPLARLTPLPTCPARVMATVTPCPCALQMLAAQE